LQLECSGTGVFDFFGCSSRFSIWVEVGEVCISKSAVIGVRVDVDRFLYLLDIDDVYCCEVCP
jgi:hypothetical protein